MLDGQLTRRALLRAFVPVLALVVTASRAHAGSLVAADLRRDLRSLALAFDGRVGICARDASSTVHVNGDQRFPMQSVMKLVVAAAALDAVDWRGWRLDDPVLVRREDLSLYIQPLADLVGDDGYPTTLGDLIVRAVVDSDNAANDILFSRLGGLTAIRAFLERNGIEGVRVDRDERHLQTAIVGLTWRSEYVDASVLERAIAMVPEPQRDATFAAYLADERDTATPEGMTSFLHALVSGELLSPASTEHLIATMRRTATFPDRLAAGVPASWTLGHKTGTGPVWKGVAAATNDVGILTAPDGGAVSVAVFVAGSRRPSDERAALISNVARAVTGAYR